MNKYFSTIHSETFSSERYKILWKSESLDIFPINLFSKDIRDISFTVSKISFMGVLYHSSCSHISMTKTFKERDLCKYLSFKTNQILR